jgi:transcriptional regulator with AAA-type ATPase domain/tetratricopeptide (TPR) repeat protein
VTFIGKSPAIQAVRERLERLLQQMTRARRAPVVLLEGETGTGKGLVARQLHQRGPRPQGPFVDVNCAAIPETLLEAELFGFERGAFTDARQAKPGLFQAAHGGTIFLDEIGLLPVGLQAKLLKVIEERAVRRLGSTQATPVDVWIIAATNETLSQAVSDGRVRADFYHRLAGFVVHMPPLRERGEDVSLLAEHFLTETCTEYGLAPKRFSPDAVAALRRHSWPGNVRELHNVIERAVVLADGFELQVHNLELPGAGSSSSSQMLSTTEPALRSAMDRFERARLLAALEEARWNVSSAAERLGVPRNTLRYRMARYGLRPAGSAPRRRRTSAPGHVANRMHGPVEPRANRHIVWLYGIWHEPSGVALSFEMSRFRELVIERIENFGGRVEEFNSHGILGVFGVEPSEDASRRAVHAGLAMCKVAARMEPPQDVRLKVVIHVVPASVEEHDGSRQLAATSRQIGQVEMATLAPQLTGTGVAASSAIAPALDRWFQLERLADDERSPSPPMYRVIGPRQTGFAAGLARRLSPFVGRDLQFGWLQGLVERLSEGHGQVVGLVAEPGAGKSRLLHEFSRSLAHQHVRYLEGRCLSHGSGVPYLPVIDLLRRTWDVVDPDVPDAITETIRREVKKVDCEEQATYLLPLLGVKVGIEALATLSPEAMKRGTFNAIRQVIFPHDRPVVLAVEDLHWIDKTSEEFFASVVDSILGAPLLFICTYRPGYRPPWIDRSYVSQLAVGPLSEADSRSVVRAILPVETSDTLTQSIVARAEGNPFFLEELALPVIHGRPSGSLPTLPESIGDVLTARILRLPDQLRRVLETAATLGREVPVRLLDAILESPPDLEDTLQELVRLEFLYDQMSKTGRLYTFKHALIQEVAYDQLAQADRSRLHLAAGRALEAVYAERIDEVLDRLAYHYQRTDQSSAAVTYLTRLAEKAIGSHALSEAASALEQALSHAEQIDSDQGREPCVLRIVARLAFCQIFQGHLVEARDLLLHHADRLERLADPLLTGPHYFLLAGAHDHLGQPEAALAAAHRSLAEATRAGDTATAGKAHIILAHANLWAGQFRSGVENGWRAARGLAGHAEPLWLGMAHWIRGWHHILLGEFAGAANAGEQVRTIGEATGIRRLESYGFCIAGWLALLRGDFVSGIEACERASTLAPDPLARAVVLSILGEGYTDATELHAAKDRLEQALGLLRQFHMPQMECWTVCRLSQAHIAEGQMGDARDLASRGLSLAEQSSFPFGHGLAQRLLGQVAGATNSLEAAQTALTLALDTFSRLEANYEVARTLLDLAENARRMGTGHDATVYLETASRSFEALGTPIWQRHDKQ